MGGVRKLTLALAAAVCALALAACGGDDDSTSGTAADTTVADSTVEGGGSPGQAGGDSDGKGSKDGGSKDGGSKGGGSKEGGDGSTPGGGSDDDGGGGSGGGKSGTGSAQAIDLSGPPTKHKHPEPVEGKRSDGFRVPGGDNSIQEYGEEQGAEERAKAMKPIIALYRALESGDWSAVCAQHLSAPNLKQIAVLAEKSPEIKGKSCAEVLGGLNQLPGKRGPDTPDGEIVAFRVEGDTGFALWWGIDGNGYAMALKSEDGAWKLTALAPTPLNFGG
jgi:hypothetical protein